MAINIDYNSLTTGFLNYLRANSATVSGTIYGSISSVADFDPSEMGFWKNKYPAISVNLKSAETERIEVNRYQNARTRISCNWEIGAHVYGYTSYTAIRQAVRELSARIQNALTTDETLSNTVQQLDILGTTFQETIRGNNSYLQKNAIINVRTINFTT